MIGLFQIAISPLALASPAVINDNMETETTSSRKLIEEKQTNIINLRPITTPTPNTTTTSSTVLNQNAWFSISFIGNVFRVICSWFLAAVQVWKFYWWPSTKIIATPDVDIESFQVTGKISIINVTNSLSPSLSPKVHLQSVVHSIVLQAAGPTSQPSRQPTRQPTGQPSRQPTRQPTGQPSRQPSSQPTRQPTSRPSQPSGQPSRQPTRYDDNCYVPSLLPFSQ